VAVILHATFDVKYGALGRFEEAMTRFVPAMVAQDWRLIGAYKSLTGKASQAIHIWEIPSADSLIAAPPKALAEFEHLLSTLGELVEIIERETLQLLSTTSYSSDRG
jgi:hypothetical protein